MINLPANVASYSLLPLFLFLLIGGIIGNITFFFLSRVIKTPGAKFLLICQIAASIWAFTYAFEFGATDLQTKIMWSKFSYFGIVYCPLSFLFFSLAFASKFKFLKKRIIIAAYAFATLFIVFPFTNDLHHLHWKSYSIDPITHAAGYVYGPLFWIMAFFAYLALIGGIINIFLLYLRFSNYYRKQITLLLMASVLPLVGNLFYIFQLNPITGFDCTPFTFLFSGFLITINLSYFKVFELVPFARTKLIELISDAILVVDNALIIADFNPALRKIIDPNIVEVTGKSVLELFPHRETIIAQIHSQDNFQTEISKEIAGRTYYFDLQSATLLDQNKQPMGKLLVFRDITRHIEAEDKIMDSNKQLMDQIKEKEKLIGDLDSFSHTVAHDLKNMLGAIVSASNLIKMGIDDMRKEDLLEINDLIRQSATKTMDITRELLTLASVRQQDVKLLKINMQRIVIEAMNRLNDMILENNAQVIVPEHWHDCLGYEGWIEEVWINYISNAIKYGGIPPVIQMGSEVTSDHRVKFWIKDNGKGLSESDRALLFNKFTRLDTLRAEGHGLGLSIVRRIVEKLNGEVGVESKNIPGEGCTFYFILPEQTA